MRLTVVQQELSARIGHQFRDATLLIEALTHASLYSTVQRDNQRLEFLGDRVLGLTIAEALLRDDPDAAEGQLAPRFNALVRKETCAEVAIDIDLGPALLMGRSESASGGRRKTAMLADAMEAVIAAVYLDAGFEAAKAMVLRLWAKRIAGAGTTPSDPKTALQEWAQARGMALPDYVDTDRTGPDHAPEFTVTVSLETGQAATATAASKRAAQRAAAKKLLKDLETGS